MSRLCCGVHVAGSEGTPKSILHVTVAVGILACSVVAQAEDLADFAAFQRCFGPLPEATCRMTFDCNANGEIDLSDYAAFYGRFVDLSAPPCGMVLVPGGEFEMGDHHDDMSSEVPVHDVYVDSFYIDVYEVTNERYCNYLNSAYPVSIKVHGGIVFGIDDDANSNPYCDTYDADVDSRIHFSAGTFTATTGKENHPMVLVSWYGTAAYANWRSAQDGRTPSYDLSTWTCNFDANGYRLPNEAEWEYAARGGEHDPYYRYPWGDTIDGSMANYGTSGDPFETGDHPWTTPVEYYDGKQEPSGVDMANGYGLYDMAGNVWEWCNDWWGPYSHCDPPPCDNPHGPASGTHRVIVGGSWVNSGFPLRCATRGLDGPDYRASFIGSRLALDSD